MKFCYADPPYLNQAKRHYGREEVDHQALIHTLKEEYDGWALSCSSPSLPILLSYCPPGIRIAAWVKPFAFFHSGTRGRPPFAWEPVIFYTPRKCYRQNGVRDWLACNAWGVTAKEREIGIHGVKPPLFCEWLFELLGLEPDDELVDLFPGSGMVTNTWQKWCTAYRGRA